MTNLEHTLVEAHRFLNEIDLPHFIHGSTLLGFLREGGLMQREIPGYIPFDREMNFGCYYEDVTDDQLRAIEQRWPFTNFVDGHKPHTQLFFGTDWDRVPTGGNGMHQWNNPEGFVLLNCYHRGKDGLVFTDMGESGSAKTWPQEFIGEQEDWHTMRMYGYEFDIPAQPIKYFEYYYGKDWTTPNDSWQWVNKAHNLKQVKEVKRNG